MLRTERLIPGPLSSPTKSKLHLKAQIKKVRKALLFEASSGLSYFKATY